MNAAHVWLRVEGVDERGGVTGRRESQVLGQVPSAGLARYCIVMSAGAASYRVSVIGADWITAPESP